MLDRALALHRSGDSEAARTLYRSIIARDAGNFDALHLLGVITAQGGDPAAGLSLMDRAIAINPGDVAVRCNRGVALRALGRLDAALASFDAAIALRPDCAEAYVHRGVVLRELRQPGVALASYDRAIALRPDAAAAHFNRGNLLRELRQPAAAVESYDRAIALRPDFADAFLHRGNVLRELRQPQAALASYDQALAIKADYAEAHLNRGTVLREAMQLEAALQSYNRAIALRPDYAEAYANRATVRLLLGDFDHGWRDYEWRWSRSGGPDVPRSRHGRERLWLGESSLEGKTILLSAEQGLGDTLQFCRYAAVLSGLGARVLLEVQPPLVSVLATVDGVSQVFAIGSELPSFELHCPLLSLPLALKTRIDSIPAAQGYLQADAARVAKWRERLAAYRGLRIGLAWSGNRQHSHDRDRSIPLATLLAGLPTDFQYISLQKDVREVDARTLHARADVLDLRSELRDFDDTAALCKNLDVVISVDSAVAHLSGALGQPTWVLLPFHPDWRWLTERSDSPWYRSVRLFRQVRAGRWDEVVARVSSELVARLAQSLSSSSARAGTA